MRKLFLLDNVISKSMIIFKGTKGCEPAEDVSWLGGCPGLCLLTWCACVVLVPLCPGRGAGPHAG
eukprot:scaffold299498_cov13-Prasinocladus_malaysianus.AAC.1